MHQRIEREILYLI
jgi:Timeless protein